MQLFETAFTLFKVIYKKFTKLSQQNKMKRRLIQRNRGQNLNKVNCMIKHKLSCT